MFRMKNTFLLLISILFIIRLNAQTTADYQKVINKGKLPAEVYTPSTIKFRMIIDSIDNELDKSEVKTQAQYYLASGFSIDEMMRSGLVLYNPEYNDYLNSIADILLKDDPELRSKLHFYLLRSPVVNAFAGAGGNIFISMGLISMLDNEAQLAYVMGHEIGHIAKDHGLDFYLEATAIDKKSSNNSLLKKSSFDENIISKNLYSQTLEMEADAYGIARIIDSKYSADTVTLNGVFDVLKYSYMPYENIPFNIHFFEGPHYVISKNMQLDSVKKVTGTPEFDDEKEANKSTHPSIGERRSAVNFALENVNLAGRQKALVSEDRFLQIRNMARYELPMFYLHNQFYQDAIYASYIALQKEPDNEYLQKIVAKSLTSLTKFRNSKDDETYAEKAHFEDFEGQQQQLYYLLWAMNDVELNVMALNYTYNLHRKFPNDPEIMPLCKTLVNDLVVYHFDNEDFFLKNDSISIDSLSKLADIGNPKIKLSKTKKTTTKKSTTKKSIASKSKTATTKPKVDKTKAHLLYAFNDYWKDPEFNQLWEDAIKEREDREQLARTYKNAGFKYNGAETRNYFYADNLGIGKVVAINPFYERIDQRHGGSIEYISGEKGELNYLDILKQNAALLDMDIEIIDPLLLNENDVVKFNDMNELNDWFSEQLDFGNLNIPGYNQSIVDSLANKYDTDYFLWTGIISLRDQKNILGPILYIGLSPFFPPLLPYGIYKLVAPQYEFFYLGLLYDVKTREAHVLKFLYLNNNDTRAILNSHTYEMLHQISSKPKHTANAN